MLWSHTVGGLRKENSLGILDFVPDHFITQGQSNLTLCSLSTILKKILGRSLEKQAPMHRSFLLQSGPGLLQTLVSLTQGTSALNASPGNISHNSLQGWKENNRLVIAAPTPLYYIQAPDDEEQTRKVNCLS